MAEQEQDLFQLQQTIQQLKTELDALKKLVANPAPISADAYQPLLSNATVTSKILELPLSRVIDLYRECPEILEAYVQRVTIDKKHFSLDGNTNSDQPLTFNANPNGNFWVIQLEKQGSFLFPRPNDTKRMNRLSVLDKIFQLNGNNNETETEFDVILPAKLLVTKLQTSWRLQKKGELSYDQMPLNYQWQKELTSIRQQQEAIVKQTKNLLEKNYELEDGVTRLYKTYVNEFHNFRQDALSEFAKLRSTIQTQQETINSFLANQKLTQSEKTVFGGMYSPQSESYQPGIPPVDVQGDQENSSHDPIYSEVISQFNAGSIPWFSYLIQQQIFLKVQITRDSVLGQMDMEGKVIQLKLDEYGTLLVYQADSKFWIIPNQTQPKWKRSITDSLFVSNGQTLIRPAEVESVRNDLWQLVEKGEFC